MESRLGALLCELKRLGDAAANLFYGFSDLSDDDAAAEEYQSIVEEMVYVKEDIRRYGKEIVDAVNTSSPSIALPIRRDQVRLILLRAGIPLVDGRLASYRRGFSEETGAQVIQQHDTTTKYILIREWIDDSCRYELICRIYHALLRAGIKSNYHTHDQEIYINPYQCDVY